MTAAGESAEVVVDRIENYLLVLQDDLTNVTALNQDLRIENRKKDTLIESKTAYLKSLRDVAVADVHQLEVESAAAEEDLAFQCNVVVEAIEVLKMKRLREAQMEEENRRLKASIKRMETAMQSDRAQHAHDMHVLNKRMQEIRKQMEKTLKVQLTEMDRGYKQWAFVSLTERQKQDLLQNAQMKEEKALQDAGMMIMQVRMRQQEEGMAAMKSELNVLHRQEETIRTKLGELFEEKFHLTNELNAFLEAEKVLLDDKDAILDEIEAPPTMDTLQEDIESCEAAIERERQLALMWYARLCRLRQLEAELRPVSVAEKAGYYSVANFPLTPIQLDHVPGKHGSAAAPTSALSTAGALLSSRPGTGLAPFVEGEEDKNDDYPAVVTDAGSLRVSRTHAAATAATAATATATAAASRQPGLPDGYTVKLSHLAEAQRRDRALSAALQPLHGREGVLLSNPKPIPTSVMPQNPSGVFDPPTLASLSPTRPAPSLGSAPRHATDGPDGPDGIAKAPPPAALSPQKSMRMALSKRGSLVNLLKQMQKDTNRGPSEVAQNMVAFTALEIVKIWQQTRHARYGASEHDAEEDDDESGDDDDNWADGPLGMDPSSSWRPFGHDSQQGSERRASGPGRGVPLKEEAPPPPKVKITTIFDEDPNDGTDETAACVDLNPIRLLVQDLVEEARYTGVDPDGAEDLDVLKRGGHKFSFLRPSMDAWKQLEDAMEGRVEIVGDGGVAGGVAGGAAAAAAGQGGRGDDATKADATAEGAQGGSVGSDTAARASAPSPGNSSYFSSPSVTPRTSVVGGGVSVTAGAGARLSILFAENPAHGIPPISHAPHESGAPAPAPLPHKHLRIDLDAEPLLPSRRDTAFSPFSPFSAATQGYESPMGRRSTTFLARFEQDSVRPAATSKAREKFSLMPPLKVRNKVEAHPLVASAQPPPTLAMVAAARRRSTTILPWGSTIGMAGVMEALGGGGGGGGGDGGGFSVKGGLGSKGPLGPSSADAALSGFRAFGGRKGGRDDPFAHRAAPGVDDPAGLGPGSGPGLPIVGLPTTGLSLDAELDLQDVLQRSAASKHAADAPLGMVKSRAAKLVPAAPPVDPLSSVGAMRKLVMAHSLQATPGGSLYHQPSRGSAGRGEGSGRPPAKARGAPRPTGPRLNGGPGPGPGPGGDASTLWWQPREAQPQFTSDDKMQAVRKEIARSKYAREDLHEYAKRSFETL